MAEVSRREFLKYIAALGVGLAIGGGIGYSARKPEVKIVKKGAEEVGGKIKEKIKIGHIAIFSGPFSTYGELQKRGSLLAVEEINKAGGIMGSKVEIIYRDSAAKPAEAVKQVRSLVESEGCDFIIGIDSSGVVLAVAEVMPEVNKLLFVTHAATHRLTEELVYKKGIKQVFRIAVPVYQDGIMAAFIASKLPAKRWGCVHPDYEYGYASWELFKKTLAKLRPDVEFVGEAWAKIGTTDFTPLISSIMEKKPDGIHTVEWGFDLFTFVRQAKQTGLFDAVKYDGGYAWINPMGYSIDAMEALKSEYPEGCWVSGRYIWMYPDTPLNKKFVKAHLDRWGHFPAYSGETSYTAVYMIKKLIEMTKTLDIDTHIKTLEDSTVYSPAGVRFIRKKDHQAVYSVPYGQIKHDPSYPIPVLTNLQSVPAEDYYRHPPFKEMPPFRELYKKVLPKA
ncbi:hypothetical protein DRP04_04070 [Archaeoglobales archaeon]|nr:MAG: hypothetical protein B6U96_10780 [Archaeoglobales archaeon ex4484_92]RLI82389.1 MAG: hypothetical protein DRP04_04070 [Archaeoglobales archaeon]